MTLVTIKTSDFVRWARLHATQFVSHTQKINIELDLTNPDMAIECIDRVGIEEFEVITNSASK